MDAVCVEQVLTGSRKLRPANKRAHPSSYETGGPTDASLILYSRRGLAPFNFREMQDEIMLRLLIN